MICVPCMHLVLCVGCGGREWEKCPVCKQPINEVKMIYQ